MACVLKITAVRKRAAVCTTRAKFLSRAALLGIAPTGLVTYSREAIKNPYGYGEIRCTSTTVPSFVIVSAVVFF